MNKQLQSFQNDIGDLKKVIVEQERKIIMQGNEILSLKEENESLSIKNESKTRRRNQRR